MLFDELDSNSLHQFEHNNDSFSLFDHLFGQTTYTSTLFRIIYSGESHYVIIEKNKIEIIAIPYFGETSNFGAILDWYIDYVT